MRREIGVMLAQGLDVPNIFKNVPNFVKDVPNFVNNIPRVPMFVPRSGMTFNYFPKILKEINRP